MSFKLSPEWNLYQYLTVFIVACILDLFIHFFAERKFISLTQTKEPVYGFFPELNYYYKSLSKYGPFEYTPGHNTTYNSINSWLLGSLITGTICLLTVVLCDIIFFAYDCYK